MTRIGTKVFSRKKFFFAKAQQSDTRLPIYFDALGYNLDQTESRSLMLDRWTSSTTFTSYLPNLASRLLCFGTVTSLGQRIFANCKVILPRTPTRNPNATFTSQRSWG